MLGRVAIIGGGPAGLTLSRCLKAKGIQSTIYEKGAEVRKYGYSIVLDDYQPLLKALNVPFETFYAQTAIGPSSKRSEGSPFRAQRTKFEDFLRHGCEIRHGHEFKSLSRTASGVEVEFADADKITAELVVAADGTHSPVRAFLLPHFALDVLPYVAINGKTKMSADQFRQIKDSFDGELTLSYRAAGSVLLQAYVNEYLENGGASLSYTYSRPATGSEDPCHKPNRPKASAKDIPQEFFDEVEKLRGQGIPQPWKMIFDVERMQSDRMLHWLLRTGLPSESDLKTASEKGVVLLGDALFSSPIIGSRGANLAMSEALELANAIADGRAKVQDKSRWSEWRSAARDDIQRLDDMHSSTAKM